MVDAAEQFALDVELVESDGVVSLVCLKHLDDDRLVVPCGTEGGEGGGGGGGGGGGEEEEEGDKRKKVRCQSLSLSIN